MDLVAADNGILLRGFTAEELTSALNKLSLEQDTLKAMQQCSREKIAHWSFQNAALAIQQAVELTGRPDTVSVRPAALPRDVENSR